MGINAIHPNEFEEQKPNFMEVFFAVMSYMGKLRQKDEYYRFKSTKVRADYQECYQDFKNTSGGKSQALQSLMEKFTIETINFYVQSFHAVYQSIMKDCEDLRKRGLLKYNPDNRTRIRIGDSLNREFKFRSSAIYNAFSMIEDMNIRAYEKQYPATAQAMSEDGIGGYKTLLEPPESGNHIEAHVPLVVQTRRDENRSDLHGIMPIDDGRYLEGVNDAGDVVVLPPQDE